MENRQRPVRLTERLPPRQKGAAGWLLPWLLRVPVPILLVLFVLRGCS